MEWFKTWLGLKIWLAIWLLVLLIPTWRQDAFEQWSGDKWDMNAAGKGWAADETPVTSVPADFAAQLEAVSNANSVLSQPARAMEAYADLSRRFPRENAIRKSWLLAVTMGALRIDTKEDYGDFSASQRPRTVEKNWISDAQLAQALKAAREGARIEPQNAFFPWMESVISFALQQENNAIAAVSRAARCANFDDGTLETARRRVALRGGRRALRWNDKMRPLYSLLLPHLGKVRAAARAAMGVARRKHERGDKIGALQIAADVAGAGRAMSHSRTVFITVLVGDAVQFIGWKGALSNAGRPMEKLEIHATNEAEISQARIAYQREIAEKAATYARELKQEIIARQALGFADQLKGQRLSRGPLGAVSEEVLDTTKWLARAFWLEAWLLWFSVAGALTWLFTLVFTRRAALEGKLRRNSAMWAAASIGATAVTLGVAVTTFGFGAIDSFQLQLFEKQNYEDNIIRAVMVWWLLPLGFGPILKVILPTATPENSRAVRVIRLIKSVIYVAIAGSLLVFWLISNFGDNVTRARADSDATFALLSSLLAALFFHVAATKKDTARLAALLFWLVPFIIWGALIDFEGFVASIWAIPTVVLICGILGLCAHLTNWQPASRFRLQGSGLSDPKWPQALLIVTILVSFVASVAVVYPKMAPTLERIWPAQGLVLAASLLVASAWNIRSSQGQKRTAALMAWSSPLVLLGLRIVFDPFIDNGRNTGWVLFVLAIPSGLLVWSARLAGWHLTRTAPLWFIETMGRARILAATLAVACALSYVGVRVTMRPREAQMNAYFDAQLKEGEVAYLEKRLK